jgi:hypothetical protein
MSQLTMDTDTYGNALLNSSLAAGNQISINTSLTRSDCRDDLRVLLHVDLSRNVHYHPADSDTAIPAQGPAQRIFPREVVMLATAMLLVFAGRVFFMVVYARLGSLCKRLHPSGGEA